MIRYDYRDGLNFYEQFRPSLVARSETSRVYAASAAIIQSSGLLHFLDKFKRKGSVSPRTHSVNPKGEEHPRYDGLPDEDAQELIYVLAGMMRSVCEVYGTSERKDYP
jgi:hypothetical protein